MLVIVSYIKHSFSLLIYFSSGLAIFFFQGRSTINFIYSYGVYTNSRLSGKNYMSKSRILHFFVIIYVFHLFFSHLSFNIIALHFVCLTLFPSHLWKVISYRIVSTNILLFLFLSIVFFLYHFLLVYKL